MADIRIYRPKKLTFMETISRWIMFPGFINPYIRRLIGLFNDPHVSFLETWTSRVFSSSIFVMSLDFWLCTRFWNIVYRTILIISFSFVTSKIVISPTMHTNNASTIRWGLCVSPFANNLNCLAGFIFTWNDNVMYRYVTTTGFCFLSCHYFFSWLQGKWSTDTS